MAITVVSVFGGGSPRPGDPAYVEAERLGRLLAEAGYVVMTGGYAGVMEAASKGARQAGGRTIGVTVGMFDQAGRQPNHYVDEVVTYDLLSDRLLHVVSRCDAAIALPGGIGTLSEVALTWSLLQVGQIAPMPLVLVGDTWHSVMLSFYGAGHYIREQHLSLLQFARTPEQAVRLIAGWGAGVG
jgi:hypothetical protein